MSARGWPSARLLIDEGRLAEVAELLEPVAYDQRAAALLARARLADVDQPDVAAGLAALDRGAVRAGARPPGGRRRAWPTRSCATTCAPTMLGVFAQLGEHHPLAVRFRRRLAQALY